MHVTFVLECVEEFPCVGVPDFGGIVQAPGDNASAVGTEGHVPYVIAVVECVEEFPCVGVPDFGSVVQAPGDNASAVGTEGHVVHNFIVSFDGVKDVNRVDVNCLEAVFGAVVPGEKDEENDGSEKREGTNEKDLRSA